MISHEASWWDIFVIQLSLLCQWYFTKRVGEIFLWYKYLCYVNDISRNLLVRYFCGKSDTNDTSDTNNTAYSSDASKLFLATS